jgi:hypothetical protein
VAHRHMHAEPPTPQLGPPGPPPACPPAEPLPACKPSAEPNPSTEPPTMLCADAPAFEPSSPSIIADEATMLMRRLCDCGAVYSAPPNLLQALMGALVQVAAQQSHPTHAPDRHPPQPSAPLLPCALQEPSPPPTQLPLRVPLLPPQPPSQQATPSAAPQRRLSPAPRGSPAAAHPSRARAVADTTKHDTAHKGQVPPQHPAFGRSPLGLQPPQPPPRQAQPPPAPPAPSTVLQQLPPGPMQQLHVPRHSPEAQGGEAPSRNPALGRCPLGLQPLSLPPLPPALMQPQPPLPEQRTRCLPQERRTARNRAAHSRRARRRTRAAARGHAPPRRHNHVAEQCGEMLDIPLPPRSAQRECRRQALHVPRASAVRRLSFG